MAKLSLLKTDVLSILLRAARFRLLKPIVVFFFTHMEHLLPVERLIENAHWVAFLHPQPDYPLHILILSKQPIISLAEASLERPDLYTDLFQIVNALISDFELNTYGYRLITNGGPNQLIPQWHWHLISDHTENGNA